jgi:hypothetical protein
MKDQIPTGGAYSSGTDVVRIRHPLGLPAGSVRALLTLMVVGLFCLMLLLPENPDKPIHVPLYLFYLTFFVLGSYFATRGHTESAPGVRGGHPLHLPRGSIRLLTIVGFIATIAWGFYHNPDILRRLVPSERLDGETNYQSYVPLVLLGGFFAGILVQRLAGLLLARRDGQLPAWYQDLLAWLSLLVMLALGIEIVVRLVIYPRAAPDRQFDMPYWEGFVAGLVSFYFGTRSNS